jgi:hypothetical protein
MAVAEGAPMRGTIVFSLVVVSSLVIACSDAPKPVNHGSSRGSQAGSGAPTNGGGQETSPAGAPSQAGGSTGGSSAPAPNGAVPKGPPPPAGVCANPTCTATEGVCGCTANDTTGATVAMDCEGGVCTCTTGEDITTQFGDDGCASDADARTLYFANCQCL